MALAASQRFAQLDQAKPAEVDKHVAILELLSEKVLAAMEEKENEAKRARTVRYEYHRDVEQVQTWICQAEGRVQDRNLEPQTLKEFLQVRPRFAHLLNRGRANMICNCPQELQCEIGLITDQMERVSRHGTLICQRTRDEHEQQLVRTTLSNLTDQLQQVRSWLEEKRLQVRKVYFQLGYVEQQRHSIWDVMRPVLISGWRLYRFMAAFPATPLAGCRLG